MQPDTLTQSAAMTSGACPENPAELLMDPRLANLLSAARGEYDFVVVDTPPILAVIDPGVIAPLTDGVLIVVPS